jgi:putative addiction module component (TIGR02574 family)
MSPSADSILNAALSLPPSDRATVAEKLLESLEGEEQAEIDRAWVEEAERRIRDYEQGKARGIPAHEVMRSLSIRKK